MKTPMPRCSGCRRPGYRRVDGLQQVQRGRQDLDFEVADGFAYLAIEMRWYRFGRFDGQATHARMRNLVLADMATGNKLWQ